MSILKLLWLFLPAGIANIFPVLVQKVGFLNVPIDLGHELGGQPLFGSHKTYRGFFFGVLAASLFAMLQDLIIPNPYLLGWQWGALTGFGALAGDLAKSFIKRRFAIGPGEPMWGFDQVDWAIGAIAVSEPLTHLGLQNSVIIIIIGGLLHPLFNIAGYLLGLKDNIF